MSRLRAGAETDRSATVDWTATLERIPGEFGERALSGRAPGGVYAFGRGLRTVAEGGYGLTDPVEGTGVPGVHHAYRIASCTKSFTAALALILRDEGSLDLDRPAADYLPSLGSAGPGVHQTARMFLTMSAGLATDNSWADRQESMDRSALDTILSRGLPLISTPGSSYSYSNLGFAILGRIMEEVSGRTYAELLTERILTPLGLAGTSLDHQQQAAPVPGFWRSSNGWAAVPYSSPGAFSPIGGLFSTAADLAVWAQWLCAAFDPGAQNRPEVLSAASRREMQQGHRMIPCGRDRAAGALPRAYGYGVFVEEHPVHGPIVSHSGGYPGFSSHLRWSPATGLWGLGLENASYAAVQQPVAALFEDLNASLCPSLLKPWPSALRAKAEVQSLILGWDDSRARELFADNMEQDLALDQRRQELSVLLEQTGPLDFRREGETEYPTPAQVLWTISGAYANLRCSLEMTPVRPERVQKLEFWISSPGDGGTGAGINDANCLPATRKLG